MADRERRLAAEVREAEEAVAKIHGLTKGGIRNTTVLFKTKHCPAGIARNGFRVSRGVALASSDRRSYIL